MAHGALFKNPLTDADCENALAPLKVNKLLATHRRFENLAYRVIRAQLQSPQAEVALDTAMAVIELRERRMRMKERDRFGVRTHRRLQKRFNSEFKKLVENFKECKTNPPAPASLQPTS